MNFETPNFNDAKLRKPGKELLSPDFLQEQARLPRGQWDEKFQKFIEEKIQENDKVQEGADTEAEEQEETQELLSKRTFDRYMNGLGLDEKAIKNKKILDLGCGEGEFVKYCVEKGIAQEAYGLDSQLDERWAGERHGHRFIEGNFEDDLPAKDFDLIISVGAVSNTIWGGKERSDIRRIIKNSLDSIKKNGEIRIYPVQEAAKATPLAGLEASCRKWKEVLGEISDLAGADCRLEPRDIKVIGNNNDIIIESVLIIRKIKSAGSAN
jgi:SAM-dependent methyltransferase